MLAMMIIHAIPFNVMRGPFRKCFRELSNGIEIIPSRSEAEKILSSASRKYLVNCLLACAAEDTGFTIQMDHWKNARSSSILGVVVSRRQNGNRAEILAGADVTDTPNLGVTIGLHMADILRHLNTMGPRIYKDNRAILNEENASESCQKIEVPFSTFKSEEDAQEMTAAFLKNLLALPSEFRFFLKVSAIVTDADTRMKLVIYFPLSI